jgi:hypothetical protein
MESNSRGFGCDQLFFWLLKVNRIRRESPVGFQGLSLLCMLVCC